MKRCANLLRFWIDEAFYKKKGASCSKLIEFGGHAAW